MWYKTHKKLAAFTGYDLDNHHKEMAQIIIDNKNNKAEYPEFEGDKDEQWIQRANYLEHVHYPQLAKKIENILNERHHFKFPIHVEISYDTYAEYFPESQRLALSPSLFYKSEAEILRVCEHELSHAKEFDYALQHQKPHRQLIPDQKNFNKQMMEYEERGTLKSQGLDEENIEYYNTPTEIAAFATGVKNDILSLPAHIQIEIKNASRNFQTFILSLEKHSNEFKQLYPYLTQDSLKQMVLIVYNSLYNPKR